MEKKMETTIQGLGLGFPRIRGTLLGVPLIRIIVFPDLFWGHLIFWGNLQVHKLNLIRARVRI